MSNILIDPEKSETPRPTSSALDMREMTKMPSNQLRQVHFSLANPKEVADRALDQCFLSAMST